ncbi:MAG: helix-turn-helix domain-containing protein, partial [Nitrospirae bacterium]|nr:helix-turn-helix domain-containing protein [Nitrospirota bacterium]
MRDQNFIGNFFTAYNTVIEKTLPHLSTNEKLLFVTLINGSWLKGHDYVWASLSELRLSSGLAENTIKKTLKTLVQKNLI